MNAIEFRNVSKKFMKGDDIDSIRDLVPAAINMVFRQRKVEELDGGEFWALKDVSFELKKGSSLGIVGQNGAGKTTILKLISRILRPNSGSVRVNGRLGALIDIGAGFHHDLTGRENIFIGGVILGMNKREIARKLDSVIAFSGLEDFIDTPVKRYSQGMAVRLSFSLAIHMDPEILLIDEILSVGDITFQKKSLDKIKELIGSGVTSVFVSHNLPLVSDLCQEAILLNKGLVTMAGRSTDCIHRYYWTVSGRAEEKDGPVRIDMIALLNSKNENEVAFRAGDAALLRVGIVAEEQLDGVYAGFVVKRDDGMVVFDSNSLVTAGQSFSLKQGFLGVIETSFNTWLSPGVYHVQVYICNAAGNTLISRDDIVQFSVFGPKLAGASCTFLDPKWNKLG